MGEQPRRFTNGQIAAIAGVVVVAVGLGPAGAVAASHTFTSIADPSHPAHQAHVTSKGGLAVTPQDGKLTVDGSVRVFSPAATWHFTSVAPATYYDLTKPASGAVNLTSVSFSGDSSTGYNYVAIYAKQVPASTTSGCHSVTGDTPQTVWQGETQNGDAMSNPFPTPLRATSSAGKKVCLYAYHNSTGGSVINASGYYGG